MVAYLEEALKVSHHPLNFDFHKHCGSGDIILLVCYLIMGEVPHQGKLPSCIAWWPQPFWQGRYNTFSLSRDFARTSYRRVMFMGRGSSQQSTVLLSLVAINITVMEMFSVVEEQGFRCPCLNLLLLFISKVHEMPCSRTQNFRTQR